MRALSLIFFSITLPLASFADSSPQLIFDCKSQHSMFDGSFVQGSELYLKVYHHESINKLSVITDPATQAKTTILKESDNSIFSLSLKSLSLYAQWVHPLTKPSLSMVQLGHKNWGLVLTLDDTIKKRDPSLAEKNELELMCKEVYPLENIE